jgi:DNA-binding transcriptional ArsR family regulator
MNIEDVLCSKTRMKILKLLFQYWQLNTSDLAYRLRTNYETTLRHLALLEKEGIVTQRLSGRTRFFRFANSLKAQATMKLLEEWL